MLLFRTFQLLFIYKNFNTQCNNYKNMLRSIKDGQVILNIKVKPNAKNTQVLEIDDNQLHIQIAAPPRDGECNEALIKYISKIVNVKKSDISIISGHKSREKILNIIGNYEDIMNKINKLKEEI